MPVLPTPQNAHCLSQTADTDQYAEPITYFSADPATLLSPHSVGWPFVEPRSAESIVRRRSWLNHHFKNCVLKQLDRIESPIRLIDQSDCNPSQPDRLEQTAPAIYVTHPRFYRMAIMGGMLGVAESYLRGDWHTPNLLELIRTFARDVQGRQQFSRGWSTFVQPWHRVWANLRRNTMTGSRRNIAAHYDLSNDFFQLMLDRTMAYSAGIFSDSAQTLQQASIEKFETICRKLKLTANDRVLEIGTGWGGFAIHAAKHHGCHVTTTTISGQQHEYAAQEIRAAGLENKITLLMKDYRHLQGQFDKVVSIEMIEAVGKKYLPIYFSQCCHLLKPAGQMLLQAIVIPDDRLPSYCRNVDFIQRYIFPGGFLPSPSLIKTCLKEHTDFELSGHETFGLHYAETLARWRSRFWDQIEQVRQLGFDERFIRMWHYYLCYCEAGFREHQIDVSHWLLTRMSQA